MLFDLRGRHRRRAVRVIYGGLAVLFGSGLVLFGVGGFGGTGILTSLTGEGGGSGGGQSYSSQVKKYRKLTEQHPNDIVAWENLAKNLYHEGGNEPYTTSAGELTSKGKELYKQIAAAWTSYVALNPPKTNPELANFMTNVFSEEALDEPAKEVEALQIVVADRPTDAAAYAQLAIYAYKAHNTRIGDLASEKAVALAPSSERTRVKDELAEVRANPSGEKTATTKTDGKTYVGKLNSKGELKEATEVKSTSTSTGSTSTTSKK